MNLVGCCKEDEFLGTCKLMEDNIQVGSILSSR
jgi:hypothetical protein